MKESPGFSLTSNFCTEVTITNKTAVLLHIISNVHLRRQIYFFVTTNVVSSKDYCLTQFFETTVRHNYVQLLANKILCNYWQTQYFATIVQHNFDSFC